MIIDRILDARDLNEKLDIDYIKDEAEMFGFDYILKAIEQENATDLRAALKTYIVKNGYNPDIVKDIDAIKIDFTTIADIMEQVKATLFLSDELNDIILQVLESIERRLSFDEFKNYLNYVLNEHVHADDVKWELLKNYTNIDNINNININDIINKFYKDIEKVFEGGENGCN